ncbi:hypothetical protein QJS10_CPB18g01748 [Acorus calamus]|uniref:Gag1-like clamp domain-containing protein n=1 Tax=Acorus calamus TaxID=4465 RepID=A0AAV9CM88_ACOCL|nr:hypothetical protein QJS10_CPB18g01748 [Acorus calamus]
MESNVSRALSLEAHVSSGPAATEGKRTVEEIANGSLFINKAAIDWHESRKQWIGDSSKRAHKTTKEPIISWNTTYDDLLSTGQLFAQPIPLSEMVDFLVDIWHEDGLYE